MLKVVKIGGNVVDNPSKLDEFLAQFARMQGDKILVHGGGKIATTIATSLGVETKMVDGRRVTDEKMLDVVTMVYAGVINKKVVNKLNSLNCRAVGLSGADGELIRSKKRAPIPIDYGYVGDPERVNNALLELLLDGGYVPVVAPITTDGAGQLLNTNADTVAQIVATSMAAQRRVELIYCFEKQGVMRDLEDEQSLIKEMKKEDFQTLKKQGVVSAGMIPKLENAFEALDLGVESVVIGGSDEIGKGTRIIR